MFRVCFLSALFAGGLLAADPPLQQAFYRPLTFEPNRGQVPSQVKWLGQGSRYQVLIGGDSATIVIPDKTALEPASHRLPGTLPPLHIKCSAVRIKLAGSRPWKDISGIAPTGGVSNYANPRDLNRSLDGIPQYGRLKVANVYRGIDLILYSNGGDLEYDFALAPGADPKQIQVTFDGTKDLRVDPESGDLVLKLRDGSELRQLKPNVYERTPNKRVEVAGGYRLLGDGRAAFTLAGYDRRQPLVIDPHLVVARSIGGSKDDQASAIAVDNNGNSFITGFTFSVDLPVTDNSAFDHPMQCGGFPTFDFCATDLTSNVFVAEISSDGSIPFVTYTDVGIGNGIAVDSSGIYITGEAVPPDSDLHFFPFDNVNGDFFVQKLTLTGRSGPGSGGYLAFAGGPGTDFGSAIALDDLHNVWAAGATYPDGGAITTGDVLVFKVDPNGNTLFEQKFGSTGNDVALGIAVSAREPWITGKTCGNGFPTTDGIVHQLNHCAVFVLQLDETGHQNMGMVFGGGDADDAGVAIVTNGSNDAFVTGYVNSTTFPTTVPENRSALLTSAFRDQNVLLAGTQGFVAEVSPVESSSGVGQIIRSGLLMGSTGTVIPYAIANDNRGGLYVSGSTTAVFFPDATADTPPGPTPVQRGFVTKLTANFSGFEYSVILGRALTGVALRDPLPVFAPQASCVECFPEVYVAGWDNGTFGDPGSPTDAQMVKMIEDTPTSNVTSTAPQVATPTFTVSWAGSDPTSNISSFDVFVSDNGGPFTPFLTGTTGTSATFTGVAGHTYGFFSIATDAAGVTEPMKTAADVVVTVGPAPPTIFCTGCYFVSNGARSTLAFNVSVVGSSSRFTFNSRNGSQAVQFVSTTVSQIAATGSFATFSGQGTLNGQAGYTFTVSATDGGGAGSGLDTVLVQISGPNNFTFNAPGTIAGGDIVVHQ